MAKIGDIVKFVHTTKTEKGRIFQKTLNGKVKERTSSGYILEVVDDMSLKSMNGTICHRAESEIIKVI